MLKKINCMLITLSTALIVTPLLHSSDQQAALSPSKIKVLLLAQNRNLDMQNFPAVCAALTVCKLLKREPYGTTLLIDGTFYKKTEQTENDLPEWHIGTASPANTPKKH